MEFLDSVPDIQIYHEFHVLRSSRVVFKNASSWLYARYGHTVINSIMQLHGFPSNVFNFQHATLSLMTLA